MAAFLPDTRALLLLVLVAPAVLSAASPRALPRGTDAERVIKIEADSQELDFNSNHVLFRKITISQGATRISADEAEGDGPEMKVNDSRWQLRGNVRMT